MPLCLQLMCFGWCLDVLLLCMRNFFRSKNHFVSLSSDLLTSKKSNICMVEDISFFSRRSFATACAHCNSQTTFAELPLDFSNRISFLSRTVCSSCHIFQSAKFLPNNWWSVLPHGEQFVTCWWQQTTDNRQQTTSCMNEEISAMNVLWVMLTDNAKQKIWQIICIFVFFRSHLLLKVLKTKLSNMCWSTLSS